MGKKKYTFFIFAVFILLLFLFKPTPRETMDKKEGYLAVNEKCSVEITKSKNTKYANMIYINSIGNNKNIFSKDISSLKAWKLEVGDIDGDGVDEIALGVYTKAPLHQIDAKRPYIYSFNGNDLIPKWRGSRLSRPFTDFVFYDIDDDGWDEIIAIEILKDSRYILNSYKWKGFGFEGYLESKELQAIPEFQTDNNFLYIQIKGEKEPYKLEIDKENTAIEWRKDDEN